MTSLALQPSGLWLPCRVGVKAHRTFRSGNYYASGVNLSLLLGKFSFLGVQILRTRPLVRPGSLDD